MADDKNNIPLTLDYDRGPILAQRISQRGATSLLARTYGANEDVALSIYNGEDWGQEIGTQIPIIYGTVLLSGLILDGGRVRSDLNPNQIDRVYRILHGEGPTRGIEGVGQDKLQNIIINCQPVVDRETGRASRPRVGLREIAGLGAGLGMLGLPLIARLFNNDPVTGNPIPVPGSQTISTGSLLPGTDPVNAGTNDLDCRIVTPGPDGTFRTERFKTVMDRAVELKLSGNISSGVPCVPCGDQPPTPTLPPACVVDCTTPSTGFVISESTTPPPGRDLGMALLPMTGGNKHYNQPIRTTGVESISLHFFLPALYLEKTVTYRVTGARPNETCQPGQDSGPTTGQTNSSQCKSAGTIKVVWCLLCNGKVVAQDEVTFAGASESAFSRAVSVPVGELIEAARTRPCDRVNPGECETMTLRVYRSDNGGASTDIHFQGWSYTTSGSRAFEPITDPGNITAPPTPCPPITTSIPDDEFDPRVMPSGSYGAQACPSPTTPPSGTNAPGSITVPCDVCVIEITDKCGDGSGNNQDGGPRLDANPPRDRTYTALGSSASSEQVAAGTISLPAFTASATAEPVSVTLRITQGGGEIRSTGTSAGGSWNWEAGSKNLLVTGPVQAANALLGALVFTPAAGDTSDVIYTASIRDAQNRSYNVPGNFKILNSEVERQGQGATSNVTFAGTNGSAILLANGSAISGSVTLSGSIEQFAQAMANSVQSTRTTPDYTSAYVNGSTIRVQAPSGLGYDANGWQITVETDGDITVSGVGGQPATLDGGVSATQRPPQTLGNRLWQFAQNILPALGAGLLSNTIYSMLGNSEVRVPENNEDDDPDNIAVVYSGLLVNVPINYDPATRAYAGNWDFQTFKEAFTTNPAWCLLNFMENKRYGCGNSIRMTAEQRARLYQDIYACAVRCDESVNSGRYLNGQPVMEPRYTLNTAIANMTRLEALEAIAGAMHAQVLFTVDGPRIVQDRPRSPVTVVTNGSVLRSRGFSYSGGSLDSSYNFVEVGWVNPDKYYRSEKTLVADPQDILISQGERKRSVIAFGANNEGQAKRHGAWMIETERSNPLVVSYTAGFDHDGLLPGDLVVLADNEDEDLAGGTSAGGRILSKTSNTVYRVDRRPPVGSATVWVSAVDGVFRSVAASFSTSGNVHTMTLASPLDVAVGAVFCATASGTAEDNVWQILSITENRNGEFEVSAVKHDPSKYARSLELSL